MACSRTRKYHASLQVVVPSRSLALLTDPPVSRWASLTQMPPEIHAEEGLGPIPYPLQQAGQPRRRP